jgi:tRNA U38,U39,U40 pseudouridine synthase TruA
MVRLLTGTLIRCAAGRMDPGEIDRFLAGGGQPKTHFQAPAEGLYLARVLY